MLRTAATLILSTILMGGASAQNIEEFLIGDVPALAKQLANPKTLYPLGGLNRNRSLGIDQAYYSIFTPRYGHNIFRTSNEYTTLAVEIGADVHRVTLESDVFEDTYPLIYDLDGDGQGEIITTQSSLTEGASIAVYAVRDGAMQKIAQTPNIGTRNRWMNIAGIADFNGDGDIEIALVDRPHIRGELEFWSFKKDGSFERRLSSLGFSNHFIGSNAQRLSAVVKVNGKTLLALPSTNRKALQLVDASGDEIKILQSMPLPSPIAENFATLNTDDEYLIGVLLGDGTKRAFAITGK